MTEMGTTRVKEQKCPFCGTKIDAMSDVPGNSEGEKPTPGSLVVCVKCANVQVIEEGLALRKATKSELKRLSIQDPDVWKLLQKMQQKLKIIHARN